MNNTTFAKANGLYEAGDFSTAFRRYNDCLTDTINKPQPGEIGKIYHNIGNCLMKMKKPTDAIRAYNMAEKDAAYSAQGPLLTNVGKAYSSIKDYNNAKLSFEKALEVPNYEHRYKAYMGLGNIQVKAGDSAEAGRSFREAALDKNNPDPAKSLLNLGVCFMSLGRPEDAISTYESAQEFTTSEKTKNSILASMGQAYAASDNPRKAVECFEKATEGDSFKLSDSASVDFTRCMNELSRASKEKEEPDLSGIDTSVDDAITASNSQQFYDGGTQALDRVEGSAAGYDNNGDQFFTATEEELKQIYKQNVKAAKKKRGFARKFFTVLLILLILAIIGSGVAYWFGFGFPSQEMVTQQAFSKPDASSDVFASTVTDTSKQQMASTLVKDDSPNVTGVARSTNSSKVYVTAKTEQGGEVNYCLSMTRDLAGWKITNVELYFASQNS